MNRREPAAADRDAARGLFVLAAVALLLLAARLAARVVLSWSGGAP